MINFYSSFIKRIADVIIALIVSFFFMPLIILIVMILFFRYDKKVIYMHKRIGKKGKSFNLFKFRTMYSNSEVLLEKYLEKSDYARKEWTRNQKLYDDPRVTRFGKILRKYSLDEIPQLINVFLGEMSIVGPRPIVLDEVEKYKEEIGKTRRAELAEAKARVFKDFLSKF